MGGVACQAREACGHGEKATILDDPSKELVARLNMRKAHDDTAGIGVDSESVIGSFPREGNDLGDVAGHESSECKGGEEDAIMTTTEHISRDNYKGWNMATMTVDARASPEQRLNPILGESGAVLEIDEGEEGVNPKGTAVRTDELANDVMIGPGMLSLEHALSMALKSTDVDGAAADEACLHPLLGPSLEALSNAQGDQ
ncbi:hypothetical protein Cgig2_021308 [Carnegiea gigantea]|uniref:Uncharacterized protein n=1 Tax=Carnegiea gigantea TaxID=171969 RepID=A0A9Q1KKN4_9CARY|nr:hypothetical protein Cgig2_021308 [Carnegiea gigantea]